MASSQLPVVVGVVVLVAVLVLTPAVSGDAVTDEEGCRTELATLSPCLSYLTGKISTPSPTCCFQLKAIVETEPWCLCYGIIGQDNVIFGLPPNTPVNQTRALTLSNVCDIQGIPPVAGCKEVLPPGTAIPQLPAGAGQAGSSADGVASDGTYVLLLYERQPETTFRYR